MVCIYYQVIFTFTNNSLKFAVEKLRIKFNIQFTAIQIWGIRVANRLQSFTSDLSLTELIKGPLPDNHRYFNVFSTASVA